MDSTSVGGATALIQSLDDTEKATGINFSKLFSVDMLFGLAITFGVSLLVIFIVLKIVDHVQKLSTMDNTLKSFIRSTIKAGLWLIAIGAMLSQLGIDSKTFAAIVSIVGLALSLSLQSTLSNLFSGMTILTTKPFTAGDYVEVGEAAGTIERVELFYTTMLTAENKTIFIPNSQVAAAKIVNYSRQEDRRIELNLGVDYSTPTELVKTALLDAAKADERILPDPAPFVGLLGYQDSAVQFTLRAWTKTEDYWNVYFDLTERVRTLFNDRGIRITYNHLNVHMIDDSKQET